MELFDLYTVNRLPTGKTMGVELLFQKTFTAL